MRIGDWRFKAFNHKGHQVAKGENGRAALAYHQVAASRTPRRMLFLPWIATLACTAGQAGHPGETSAQRTEGAATTGYGSRSRPYAPHRHSSGYHPRSTRGWDMAHGCRRTRLHTRPRSSRCRMPAGAHPRSVPWMSTRRRGSSDSVETDKPAGRRSGRFGCCLSSRRIIAQAPQAHTLSRAALTGRHAATLSRRGAASSGARQSLRQESQGAASLIRPSREPTSSRHRTLWSHRRPEPATLSHREREG
jgi:hypothetical protein